MSSEIKQRNFVVKNLQKTGNFGTVVHKDKKRVKTQIRKQKHKVDYTKKY